MTLAEYFLKAELTVGASNVTRFEDRVGEFLDRGGFSRLHPAFDAQLVLGLRSPEAYPFWGNDHVEAPSLCLRIDERLSDGEPAFRFINVFRLPDVQDLDLARIMICCADDPLYTEINALVSKEIQHICTRVKFPIAVASHAAGRHYYRVERQFLLKNLGAYLFGIGACFPVLAQNGWKNLGVHQAVTGELNTLAEFWEVPDDSSAQDVLQVLEQKNPRLYELMVKPYAARAAEGWTMVDASYAKSAAPQ